MADASFAQADFRGGVWSPYAQGRLEEKEYRHSMSVCLNGYPIEEGAWTRRQGTRFCGYSRKGGYAWLLPFHFSQSAPYVMEFTDQFLRFWSGTTLVMTNDPQQVTSVSTANPAIVKTAAAHGWTTGDSVIFLLGNGVSAPSAGPALNKVFSITVTSSTQFSLQDEFTGANIDGSTFSFPAIGVSIARINTLASPYLRNQLQSVNSVIAEVLVNNALQGQAITLHPTVKPYVVAQTATPGGTTFATFSYSAVTFTDGPYFDPQATGTLIASALTGTITLSGAPANTFVSTDVGRMMRLFSTPAVWSSATGYSAGNTVMYNGLYYTALASSTNKQPDQNPTLWSINPTAAVWVWGRITSVDSDTQVHFAIDSTSANLLYGGSGNPIITWRMGLYSDTTGYPTCGVFHEGRLWLAGAQPNRFDASVSNSPFNFAPTGTDGTVADNNAVSYIFNSDDVNKIVWMTPDHQGIIAGTAGGEYLISASNLSDPLTPTSIQAKRVTKYKASSVPPTRTGLALMFVQAQAHRLMEYVSDVFSGKFMGRNMNEKSRHLTGGTIQQIGYAQDLTPIVWARMGDGTFAGMTYKRESQFTSEPPTFNGWHSHTLGSGRSVESMAVGPNNDGTLETVYFSTNDPATGVRHIELLTDMFDETTPLLQSWFLDDAVSPAAVTEDTVANTVKLYGINHLIGQTVTVVAAGLDLGDYTVAADGTVTIPLGGAAQSATAGLGLPLFTDAFFNAFVGVPSLGFSTQVNRTVTVSHSSAVSQTISTYHDTSGSVTGTPNRDYMLNDYNRNELWGFSTGSGGTNGWSVFNRLTTALKRDFTATSIFPSTIYQPSSNTVQGPATIDDNGFIYWASDSSNNTCIRKMNGTTGKIVASFGVNGSGFLNDNNKIEGIRNLTSIKVWQEAAGGIGVTPKPAGFRTFVLTCAATDGNFSVLAADDIVLDNTTTITLPDGTSYVANTAVAYNKMQWAGYTSSVTEDLCDCVTGATYTSGKLSYGDVWLLGHAKNAHLPGSTALGIYRIKITAGAAAFDVPPGPTYTGNQSTAITKTKTGTVTPAQVDATWTNFSAIYGLIFDRSTGNLLFWAQTTDAVTNKQYLVSVNPLTAVVNWATPILAAAMPPDANWQTQYYCGYGTVAFFGSGTVLNSITTAAGVLVTTSVPASASFYGSFSDDRDGQVFYADGSNIWHGLINVAGFSSQSSITTDYNLPVMPMCVGFNYTSQGQILRPVAPDATGARNGPGFAKTRRTHKIGLQLANSQQLQASCAFDSTHLKPVEMKLDGVHSIPIDTLFTGVIRTEIDCDYDYDNMICWQSARPYPATVTVVGGFLQTQDV